MKANFRIILIILCSSLPGLLKAQAPELSADAPIAYSDETGLLIATGNAVYEDENTTVEAEEIRYNRDENRIEATGNVRVTREGLRLLAEYLTYDANNKTFSARNFRAGYPPLFIAGESFSGSLEEVDFSKVSLYFREPVSSAPKLNIREGKWVSEEYLRGRGISLKAFGEFGIPLPRLSYTFGKPTIEVDGSAGHEQRLGTFTQAYILYPYSDRLSIGGNFDIYTERGILVGPALRYVNPEENLQAYVNSGWIHDHSFEERGTDLLGNRIDQDRGFLEFSLGARSDDGALQFQAMGNYLSDSEMLRDFREDLYYEQYQPDHYADFTWQEGNLLLNVLARGQINDYYSMVERLPEIRAEWLPRELADTGVYLQASAGAVRYRYQESIPALQSVIFPDNPLDLYNVPTSTGSFPGELEESTFYNRLDGVVTFSRPFFGPNATELILRAGGRWSHYNREESHDLPSASDSRLVGELGLDFSQTLQRTYHFTNPRLNFTSLLHQMRGVLQYRWHPGAEDIDDVIPPFDVMAYTFAPPVLDLADLNHIDGLQDWSVARIGWEHQLLVRDVDAPYREFLSVNFYQDLLFSHGGDDEDLFDAFYTELDFVPFPWFQLQWADKFRPSDGEHEATFIRATVSSADLWAVSLRAEYVQQAIHQYRMDAQYRLSENIGLIANLYYDTLLSSWTRQKYGIVRRFGNVWQLELYAAFNDNNIRDDRFSLGLRLRWLTF